MVERLAKEAKDRHPGLLRRGPPPRRRQAALHPQALEPLEAQALGRGQAHKERFHKARSAYQESFAAGLPAAAALPPQLKFKRPVASTSSATRADCNKIIGGTDPDGGDLGGLGRPGRQRRRRRLALPLHLSDSGDCDDSKPGQTLQDLSYAMGPPAESFYVSSVRVDLVGNGLASGVLGDFKWPTKASPLYEHSFVQLDVYVAQQVNGEWQ